MAWNEGREMEMQEAEDYEARWQYLRRQYRLLWTSILTFFPGVIVLGMGGGAFLHSGVPFFAVWLLWATWITIVGRRFTTFDCPFCKRPFFRRGGLSRPSAFEPRCVHCGMPKWTPGPMREE